MSKIDVVIPAYNVEKYIRECLNSLLPELDQINVIHVVDNGSEDSTRDVVKAWIRENSGISIFYHFEGVKSACAARNRGLRACSAEWVKFLDADDLVESGSFERAIGFSTYDRGDVLYGDFVKQFPSGQHHLIPACRVEGDAVARLKLGTTSANFFRRAAFEMFGDWDTSWTSAQENELMNRWASKGARFIYIPGVQARYRIRKEGNQISNKPSSIRQENRLRLSVRSFCWHLERIQDPRIIQLSAGELFNSLRRAYSLDSPLVKLATEKLESQRISLFSHPDIRLHYSIVYAFVGICGVIRMQKWSEWTRKSSFWRVIRGYRSLNVSILFFAELGMLQLYFS